MECCNNNYKVLVIDTTGSQNLVDFDFREYKQHSLYKEMRDIVYNMYNE